jgi:hypothetical protein
MNLETVIQQHFVDIITSKDENISTAYKVYQELVYYRFEEVFEKAFQRFKRMVSEEVFKGLIYDFLKVGAKTPILWQVSGEFKEFVVKNSSLDMPYLQDLLTFEFLEIEMFMHKYAPFSAQDLDYNASYQLSKDVNILHFEYPVHNPVFDENRENIEAGNYEVLFFYDFEALQVMCEEITPFLKEFLVMLSSEKTLQSQRDTISVEYALDPSEVKEILTDVLQKYITQGIIQ